MPSNSTKWLGYGAVALGGAASANGLGAISVGVVAKSGFGGTAIGVASRAEIEGGTALGMTADASSGNSEAEYGTALGFGALNKQARGVAIGANAQVLHIDSVALGSEAETDKAQRTSEMKMNGRKYEFAGGEPVGNVSIGSKSQTRTLTRMAAGQVNSTSTDGINGSQLYAVKRSVEKMGGM